MSLKCGIVGLPNVGKSTLFNALTNTQAAQAANYPFCTIEPNVGKVAVPDPRLDRVAKLVGSNKVIPAQIEFVDIAGLVRGASKGEGLGNQFLANIRETDAIIYVLRCFDDSDITHVENSVDPVRDLEILETELILADIASLEGRLVNLEKKARQDKSLLDEVNIMKKILKLLNSGKPARAEFKDSEDSRIARLQLLTTKPAIFVCNVAEEHIHTGNDYTKAVEQSAEAEGAKSVVISAQIEQEIANLGTDEEREEFLKAIGLESSGLTKVIQMSYSTLGLITFFTAGPQEARAWAIPKGATAPQAAGKIHTDFEKGFIRAETIAYEDYIKYQSEQKAKESGKLRLEGKEYIVHDGDILHFRFNV